MFLFDIGIEDEHKTSEQLFIERATWSSLPKMIGWLNGWRAAAVGAGSGNKVFERFNQLDIAIKKRNIAYLTAVIEGVDNSSVAFSVAAVISCVSWSLREPLQTALKNGRLSNEMKECVSKWLEQMGTLESAKSANKSKWNIFRPLLNKVKKLGLNKQPGISRAGAKTIA